MEDFKKFKVEFVENPFFENGITLNDLVAKLSDIFDNKARDFANTCYIINSIYSFMIDKVFESKDKDFYSFNYLMHKFGFYEKSVSRHRNSYHKFCKNVDVDSQNVDNFAELKDMFKPFSPSKLFELLPLSDSQIERDIEAKKITAEMTVKEIRAYVKSLKDGEPGADKVLEESDFKEEFVDQEKNTTNFLIEFEPELFEDIRKYLQKLLKTEEEQTFHDFVNDAVKLHLKNLKKEEIKLVK